jgi:hypothetical protein
VSEIRPSSSRTLGSGHVAAAAEVARADAANDTSVRVRWRISAREPVDDAPGPYDRHPVAEQFHLDRMWLDSRTVAPASRTRATSWRNTTSMSGSRPLVGSSRT